VEVIAEFDAGDPEATLHALAAEIVEYRRLISENDAPTSAQPIASTSNR